MELDIEKNVTLQKASFENSLQVSVNYVMIYIKQIIPNKGGRSFIKKRKSLLIGTLSLAFIVSFVGLYQYNSNSTTYTKEENIQTKTEKKTELENAQDITIKDKQNTDTEDTTEKIIEIKDIEDLEDISGVADAGQAVGEIEIDDNGNYVIKNLTEEDVHQVFYAFEYSINTNVTLAHQEGINSASYNDNHRYEVGKFDKEFEWMKKNFDFENDQHTKLFEEILDSIEKHKTGDNEALLALKKAVYELNLDINPHLKEEKTAMDVTVEDAKKIINGKTPSFN